MIHDVANMRALRTMEREREGELRGDACERLRHAARRYAKRTHAMRRLWADYGPDGERLA